MNTNKRDTIVFGQYVDWTKQLGGIKPFDNLSLSQLKELLDNEMIDFDDSYNSSLDVRHFYDFMEKHPEVSAIGYVVSPNRQDSRVTIEGLKYEGSVSSFLRKDFIKLCRLRLRRILKS